MDLIESLLKARPYRSSELAEKIVEVEKIKPDAARKRLSRARSPVKRLKINLPNKEKIFYLEGQLGSTLFADTVTNILIETNSAAGRALIGLKTVGGALPLSLFPKTSGTSALHSKKHLYFQKVLDQLSEINLIHINKEAVSGDLVCLHGHADITKKQDAIFTVENIALSIVKTWLSNLGISSPNAIKIREEGPTYGTFAWDIVGPSYLSGLVTFKKGQIQNAFVVGDIILNKKITIEILAPFFYKLSSLKNQQKIRPFITIIIAESFEEEALIELRKKGVIIAMPKTILGKENAALLRALIEAIEKADEVIRNNPEKFLELLKKINKIEGAALNLRSVVFDFIIARLYSLEGYQCEIRKKIITKKNRDRAEIDVLAERVERIVCIEGKAMAPKNIVTKAEIEDWIERVCPRVKQWLKERERTPATKILEFYSSTDYDQEALTLINEIKINHKKIKINFFNGKEIIEKLRALNQNSLISIYKEQFM